MTATPILETLARELKVKVDHITSAFEMIDAGLSPSFIGRFRRASVGAMLPSVLRRLASRREELVELDRRRGTILRSLEREEGTAGKAVDGIRSCMDRFELEDRFLPFRRPEPEVQLAFDRGLGGLADLLATPLARGAERAGASAGEETEEESGGPEPAGDASAEAVSEEGAEEVPEGDADGGGAAAAAAPSASGGAADAAAPSASGGAADAVAPSASGGAADAVAP
ncbi:MAG: hypothetical protein CMJ84_17120, partial [Planctomycetes bacterium]|nr:hypothetical protein [Planctomycetota bacterium]